MRDIEKDFLRFQIQLYKVLTLNNTIQCPHGLCIAPKLKFGDVVSLVVLFQSVCLKNQRVTYIYNINMT